MITLIIAIVVAGSSFGAAHYAAEWGMGWSIFIGLAAFAVFQGGVGFFLQRKIKREMEAVQTILGEGQKRLQQKMNRWQTRPPSSLKAAQIEMFNDTKIFVKEALVATQGLKKYRLWVPMIDRQMATAQLQLNWMIKEFKLVDKLMPKAILLDPTMSAMKMARMYTLDKPTAEIEKVYTKAVRRLRYNQNVLLAGLWSWILVQRKDYDGAFKALTEALKNSDNDVLKANHQTLMNNRVAHFSNSGLGDQWYQLYLEEPRVRAQRQHMTYR